MLELRNVNTFYGNIQALRDVNIRINEGEIVTLIGANGAGKSTTIKLILNLIRRDAGSIRLFGLDNIEQETAVKKRIGVVFDEPCFHDVLAPRQIGRYMKGLYADWDDQAFAGYLRDFSLPENKIVKEFSRGMKMKLAIAVALSHSPRLLVLDEATSGLDPIVRDEVLEIFNEFTREEDHSILISSHILSDLEKLCDYIAFLHQGRLLFCDEKDRLLEEYGIFVGTADQADSLQDGAVVARESSGFGGVRCLVKRDLVPAGWELERPTVEDVVLFLVKGAKKQ